MSRRSPRRSTKDEEEGLGRSRTSSFRMNSRRSSDNSLCCCRQKNGPFLRLMLINKKTKNGCCLPVLVAVAVAAVVAHDYA